MMRDVVERLKPRYKKLVELRYFQERSYEEIAEELNLPLGTVKAQLFRAREFLYQILLARESLGSTGIGDGVAIPHVRNPVVLHVSEPVVTLSFLETPIDFHALDGKPAAIATPCHKK